MEYSHLTDEELHDYYKRTRHVVRFHTSYAAGATKRCDEIGAEILRRIAE